MRQKTSALLFIACLILSGCSGAPGGEAALAPTRMAPAPGMGGLAGRVGAASAAWADEPVLFVYAAPFYGKNGQGFYALEPAVHPNARLDSGGFFQMSTVPPGSYVLVIGPAAEEGRLVVDGQGKLQIVEARAGEMNDLGNLDLAQ